MLKLSEHFLNENDAKNKKTYHFASYGGKFKHLTFKSDCFIILLYK